MISQRVIRQQIFICCFCLYIIFSCLVGSISSAEQDLASNIKAAQSKESGTAPLSSESTHPTNNIVKPSLIRNRRSNFFPEKDHLYGNNAGLNSAFLYNDQIMQNLLNSPPSKPLNYARSNFFLNYLKPRTTRYNAWDDHSLMHFGKRSLENDIITDKILVKRSADFWSPNNVLHFGKKSENSDRGAESSQNSFDIQTEDFDSDANFKAKDADISNVYDEKEYSENDNTKKSLDPWHSMMSFGKRSQNPWDHNTLHFGKRNDYLYDGLNSDKRFENLWDHNTMHFGKRGDPWHNIMSFGKKSDPWHSMMSFGKKSDNSWDHNTLHFGKKDEPWHNIMSFGKRFENQGLGNAFNFGKKDGWDHNTLHFGKRDPWDHNTLHFGKRDPWDHNTLHFGKRYPWDHNTLHFGKRDDPWHNMMSFGKRPDNLWDHNTLHFGKRDDPWHNMMSFGKKSEYSDMTDLQKREDPWHNMMSFGKKSGDLWNNTITVEDKRDDPWHSMMSFGKKADYGFDHNTLHFGKREEPWHSMMSFGKKSGNPWDHSTLHFGKKDEPWHSMMSFGKRSDPLADKNNLLFERDDYPLHNMMSFEKKQDGSIDNLSEDFAGNPDPWYEHDGMVFYKKSPWDHSTLHFGKKSNVTWESASPTEKVNLNHIKKRSTDMWNDHHTMHFGKKFDPWESHNTMHFGKKSDPLENPNEKAFDNKEEYNNFNEIENIDKKFDWDSHNTMHFGKRDPEDDRNTFLFDKRDPWDYHNTMHFGKRSPWDYHNTMHFGKRDPFDYHNTMHFGKRDPWEHYNTMHFGKRSDNHLKEGSIFSTDKSVEQREIKSTNSEIAKSKVEDKTMNKESSIRKRSPVNNKANGRSNSMKIIKEILDQASDNPKLLLQSEDLKQPLENVKANTEKNKMIKHDKKKLDNGFIASKDKDKDGKSSLTQNSSIQDDSKRSSSSQVNDKKSHIKKRSVKSNSFIQNVNDDSNPDKDVTDKYFKDEISDSVLHFGKRSIEDPDNNEGQWLDEEKEKRFDDFWNDHNTLHFGKKADLWDNHNTLHFGKKSYPQVVYSDMPSTKRDPWEHLNTLHFGKKFDPWDGHAKMHFGKKSDNWDHNVMHFGKRKELTSGEFQDSSSLEDVDPVQLEDYIQSLNVEGDDSEENNDFLDNLVILKSIINSHLKDDSIPFEERVSLLKHYLKPILKTIIDAEGSNAIPFSEPSDNFNERMNDYSRGADTILAEAIITPYKAINKIKYDEDNFNKGNEDSSYGEYGDNSKKVGYSHASENLVKSKRKYLGKAELKRYFIPFQGPKSIVYPHAWFASQIRRNSLPRTTDYARHMEMRMAEKKEDPFNSYMHFG